jgi:tetratricopeptide (TPR) repeat protein
MKFPHYQRSFICRWTRLGQVYFTLRNYESAIATLEEAVACGEKSACIDYTSGENFTPDDVAIESYYVLASAYYYLDRCEIAVPRARQALQLYLDRKVEDPTALKNVLSVFVLCRDYAGKPYVLTEPGFTNGFPNGYEEPTVLIQKPGSTVPTGTATPSP